MTIEVQSRVKCDFLFFFPLQKNFFGTIRYNTPPKRHLYFCFPFFLPPKFGNRIFEGRSRRISVGDVRIPGKGGGDGVPIQLWRRYRGRLVQVLLSVRYRRRKSLLQARVASHFLLFIAAGSVSPLSGLSLLSFSLSLLKLVEKLYDLGFFFFIFVDGIEQVKDDDGIFILSVDFQRFRKECDVREFYELLEEKPKIALSCVSAAVHKVLVSLSFLVFLI